MKLTGAALVENGATIHAAADMRHRSARLACSGRRHRTGATWVGAEGVEVLSAPGRCRRCARAIEAGRARWEVLPSWN
jgi:hypothetical protein